MKKVSVGKYITCIRHYLGLIQNDKGIDRILRGGFWGDLQDM